MSSKRQLIIPIFLPFGGCPNKCVFCDQNGIAGASSLPSPDEVRSTISHYLSTWKGSGPKEIAFYGGSFTGLSKGIQDSYLKTAFEFVREGSIGSVRVSTRPDYISTEIIRNLERYGVGTVELGAQSMSEEVLRLSGRGHSPADTVKAVAMLKGASIKVGLQFMPGLPGDTESTVMETAGAILALRPDLARVYPALVLKGTPMHKMFLEGSYAPWGLGRMVDVCSLISEMFKEAGVPIVRMGLHPSKELEEALVAGPYHQSFRQLAEGCAKKRRDLQKAGLCAIN